MSIINDALKKTQDKLTGSSKKEPNTASPSPNEPQKSGSNDNNTFMMALIIFISLGAVYWITIELKPHILELVNQYKQSVPAPQQPAVAEKSEPPVQIAAEPQPAPAEVEQPSPDTIKLSGIIYSEDGHAVLLNNNIFELNDVVEGFTIVDIKPKSVFLEKNGKTFELEVKN